MENINFIVADNLRQQREQRKMSLDGLSKLSGVSKSMLGQIERGEVNPTISTVWKIANGLKISFTELMSRPEVDCEVIAKEEVQCLEEDNGKYRNYPMFSFDSERRFEMVYIELDAGACLEAEPHPEGTQEFITVFSGKLRVDVNRKTLDVGEGSSIRFKADGPHQYQNISRQLCKISLVIYYPK